MKKTMLFTIFAILFIVNSAYAEPSGHDVEAISDKFRKSGENLYMKYCARCHHADRIGISGPPLSKRFLRGKTDKVLYDSIKVGLEQTLMPVFAFLSDDETNAIVQYIKKPLGSYKFDSSDITKSIVWFDDKPKNYKIGNIENITPVVERDGNKVWIIEDEKVLDSFEAINVHGGIKYGKNAETIFIPSRDGYITKYSLKEGRRVAKVRASVYLRNVSLDRSGNYVLATSLLPQSLAILDAETLEPVKYMELEGKVSALYEFYSKDKAFFTFRDIPKVAMLDTKTFEVTYRDIEEPIEDFFIDPFEDYIIATSRRGSLMRVFEIDTLKKVFEEKLTGMPHLFSATYWYHKGDFYFATPHLRKDFVTVWKMYDWKFEKQIKIGGDGFFVKTHPFTPYLWADNGTDELILIDKDNYSTKKLIPRKGKQYIHTEYSGNGKYTYLSIYEHDGEIIVWDTETFKELAAYPADIPVGKYNFINKNRQFYPRLFGMDVFKHKCNNSLEYCTENMAKLKLNAYEKESLNDYLDFLNRQ